MLRKNNVIAKNSLVLYLRMFLLMGVTFYTSRIILHNLGVIDYGISNVVAGVVSMLSVLNGSLSGGSSRFIMVSLAQDSIENTKSIFNTIITIHTIFAVVFFLLIQFIGLWFLTSKLQIPTERFYAAVVAFECSAVTALISIISSPFNAAIIAHEKMSAFAYVSLFEALGRLLIAFCIKFSESDRLILYSVLLVVIQLIVRYMYTIYCKDNFSEGNWHFEYKKDVASNILNYISWLIIGSIAWITTTQGINIILNMFFGPAVNAARGLSVQVQHALTQFSNSFITALRPQITHSYNVGELERMHTLLITGSKMASFLMLLILVPLFFKADYVLSLWLGDVPEHTLYFTRVILCVGLINALKEPTITAIHATGDIKKFQLVEASVMILICPIAYIGLKFYHISADIVFLLYLFIEIITQLVRVIVVYPKIGLPIRLFFTHIILRVFTVVVLGALFSKILLIYFPISSFFHFILYIIINSLALLFAIYIIGFTYSEKVYMKNIIKKLILKLNAHVN